MQRQGAKIEMRWSARHHSGDAARAEGTQAGHDAQAADTISQEKSGKGKCGKQDRTGKFPSRVNATEKSDIQ